MLDFVLLQIDALANQRRNEKLLFAVVFLMPN